MYPRCVKFFDLKKECEEVASCPEIRAMSEAIELERGKSFALPKKKSINRLHDVSKRRSTTASNAIESIKVSNAREKELLEEGLAPSTYEDFMLTGYNDALESIFKTYSYRKLDEDLILTLHQLMYEKWNPSFGGRYKTEQNYIVSGGKTLIFTPPSPDKVPSLLGNLIYQFDLEMASPLSNKLVVIFSFILNFLCIHPFQDGNGRVSRLLTTFLLLKNGYELDLYYSLSYLILDNQEGYYASLEKSDRGWDRSENDIKPFVAYMLQMVLLGYRKLNYILEISSMKGTCPIKVKKIIDDSASPISKADIEEILYSYGKDSIEKALKSLVKAKKIQLIQRGHYAKYFKI